MGVAWRVVADVDLQKAAQWVAEKISLLPPLSVRAMKRVLNQCAATNLHRALQQEPSLTRLSYYQSQTFRREVQRTLCCITFFSVKTGSQLAELSHSYDELALG